MTTPRPTIHCIDDAPATRRALASCAHSLDLPLHVWNSPDELRTTLDGDTCGVILVDIRHIDGDGDCADFIAGLAADGIDLPVIVLAADADAAQCRQAFRAGAADFLEKPLQRAELRQALRHTIGQHVLQHARLDAERQARRRYAQLSEREREVLAMIVAGLTNKEVARALEVSPRTVEVHRSRLGRKLGTDSFAQMVRCYAGLVERDGVADAVGVVRASGCVPIPGASSLDLRM
ncbi:MAG: response regulator transcription factor [Proteobacteria bacterium]|nr:response regulator transcription factor [Pseudomonadota bacterium]